jgi:NitT/TauT family transport system substrate-binding protein
MNEACFGRHAAMRRSHFIAASGAALIALPSAARAQALTKLTIGASGIGDVIGSLWAQQSGIFQKYGLDVDLQRMNSGSAITAAVAGGSLVMGRASLFALVTAYAKGIPIVVEAPTFVYDSAAPDAALVVAKDSPIQKARDLNGKVLASASLGDLFTTITAAWIDQNGGDSRTVKYIELPGTATATAIAAARVDAGMVAEPSLSEAVRSGKCRVLGYPEDVLGKTSIAAAYFCTADFASKNASMLANFRRALEESYRYVITHQSEMIPILAKYSGIDPKLVTFAKIGHAPDLLDTKMTQPTIDIAAKYKVIAKSFPMKDMIDPNVFKS